MPTSKSEDWQFAVDEQLSKDILKLDLNTAYDFVAAQFYFAGSFGGKIPVDWGRYMFDKLRQKETTTHQREAELRARISGVECMAVFAVDLEELLPLLSKRLAELEAELEDITKEQL